MTPGRKPAQQPATAYDRRRYLALVQLLASDAGGTSKGILALCEAWGVEPVEDGSFPPYRGRYYINEWATIRALAKHVIEYHRKEQEEQNNVQTTD